MPYVPPHLRKKPNNKLPNEFSLNYRRKALVIPIINNKYIVTKYKNTGNTTFISGGCKQSENIKNCARKELEEEARYSIKNRNFKKNFTFNVGPNYRSPEELSQNKNRKLIVVTTYHTFFLKPTKTFKNIYTNFHKFVPRTKAEKEMSNIMLKSLNNLNKNNKLWLPMKNKVLPELRKRR